MVNGICIPSCAHMHLHLCVCRSVCQCVYGGYKRRAMRNVTPHGMQERFDVARAPFPILNPSKYLLGIQSDVRGVGCCFSVG